MAIPLILRALHAFIAMLNRLLPATLALAGLALLSPAAHAQSSVALYGIIDTGITYTNNQHGNAAFQATASNINGTRWGIQGQEDLGSGWQAIFKLENGFSIDTGALGQNGRLFGRQSFVGLSRKGVGALTAGRQYDVVVDYLGPLALTGTSYGGIHFAHPYDNDNLDNSFRIANSVKFETASLSGWRFGALYGFSNEAGQFADNRAASFGAQYAYGGFTFAAAWLELDNAGASALDNASGAVTGDATFTAGRQRTWGAGVHYAFGRGAVGAVFTQTHLRDATGIGAYASGTTSGIALTDGAAHFTNLELNARYALTGAITLAAAYTFTDGQLDGRSPTWHQANLLAVYSFSKRTNVYLQAVYQHVSGMGGTDIGAGITGLAQSSAKEQVATTIGIRHSF